MRTSSWCALIAISVLGCGSDDDASGEDDSVDLEAAAPAAAHGGTLFQVDEHEIELVVHHDGSIWAFASDSLSPRDTESLTARIPGDDGHQHPVALTWDAGTERFSGQMRAGHPIPGPAEVLLVVAGEAHRGVSPRLRVRASETEEALAEASTTDGDQNHVRTPRRPSPSRRSSFGTEPSVPSAPQPSDEALEGTEGEPATEELSETEPSDSAPAIPTPEIPTPETPTSETPAAEPPETPTTEGPTAAEPPAREGPGSTRPVRRARRRRGR